MKTTLAENRSPRITQNNKKKRGSFDENMQKEFSREEHANPLKVKTAIFRNSLSFNTNQPYLSLHLAQQANNRNEDVVGQQFLGNQAERKQDFKRIKSQNNHFQNGFNAIKFADFIKSNHIFSHQRRLSQQSTGYNCSMDLQQQRDMLDEKENKFLIESSSMTNETGSTIKSTIRSFAQKHEKPKYSQVISPQPSFYDSSLADYAIRLGLTGTSKEDPSMSLIKDQIQLILKRLAKNECDIQTLKRDKSIDIHMERVWKEISAHQGLFDKFQRGLPLIINQKLAVWQREIDKIKNQMIKFNQQKTTLTNSMKNIQSKVQLIGQRKQQQSDFLGSQRQSSRMKRQLSTLFETLSWELNNKVQSKLKDMRVNLFSEDRIDEILRTGRLSVANKRAINSINLVYRDILRVRYQKEVQQNSSNYQGSNRLSLFSKDFSAKRFSSLQETPHRDIEINSEQYFIDEKGYLLDDNKFYIVDGSNQPIMLDDRMRQKLQLSGILK